MGCNLSGSNRVATSTGHTTIPLAWYASDDYMPTPPLGEQDPPPPPYSEEAENGHVTIMKSPISSPNRNSLDTTNDTLSFSTGLPIDMNERSTMELVNERQDIRGVSMATNVPIARDINESTTKQVNGHKPPSTQIPQSSQLPLSGQTSVQTQPPRQISLCNPSTELPPLSNQILPYTHRNLSRQTFSQTLLSRQQQIQISHQTLPPLCRTLSYPQTLPQPNLYRLPQLQSTPNQIIYQEHVNHPTVSSINSPTVSSINTPSLTSEQITRNKRKQKRKKSRRRRSHHHHSNHYYGNTTMTNQHVTPLLIDSLRERYTDSPNNDNINNTDELNTLEKMLEQYKFSNDKSDHDNSDHDNSNQDNSNHTNNSHDNSNHSNLDMSK